MTSDSTGVTGEGLPATIVPRWEWRTFGADESAFAELAPESVQESDELYLLSARSDASVKVRSELMDVKRLEHVNGDGLEQWMPVMKARFPIPAADVGFVLTTLGVAVPALARSEYTLDELVAEIVDPSAELLAVGVHKRREHYRIDGCMAELTDVRTEAGATRTIAVESEDPGLVTATVRQLGLGSRRNVESAARAQGAALVRRSAVRRHRHRHELGQVPSRRATRRRRVADDRRPRRALAAR